MKRWSECGQGTENPLTPEQDYTNEFLGSARFTMHNALVALVIKQRLKESTRQAAHFSICAERF